MTAVGHDRLIAFVFMGILWLGWMLVALHGWWMDKRAKAHAASAESEPGWDRKVKEALANRHHTPERVTFEAPVIWHPSVGDRALNGLRIYNEEHPARTAERILRGEGA